jgi:hypothetical protein
LTPHVEVDGDGDVDSLVDVDLNGGVHVYVAVEGVTWRKAVQPSE